MRHVFRVSSLFVLRRCSIYCSVPEDEVHRALELSNTDVNSPCRWPHRGSTRLQERKSASFTSDARNVPFSYAAGAFFAGSTIYLDKWRISRDSHTFP